MTFDLPAESGGLMRRAHAMRFGSELAEDGVRFALWAPTADDVTLVVDGSDHPIPEAGEGWRVAMLPEAPR
jgi:maltooligosyltrehalose trehalohydrolase